MGTLRCAAGSVADAAGVAGGSMGTLSSGAVTVLELAADAVGATSVAVGDGVKMSHR
jgi:hypothetical protein